MSEVLRFPGVPQVDWLLRDDGGYEGADLEQIQAQPLPSPERAGMALRSMATYLNEIVVGYHGGDARRIAHRSRGVIATILPVRGRNNG